MSIQVSTAKYDAKCFLDAVAESPDDVECAFCGGMNTWADDCGFFYCYPLGLDNYGGPTCGSCGIIHRMHEEKFGVSER